MYGRVCVGGVLKPEALVQANVGFLAGLSLPAEASADEVFQRLRDDTPKHKLHEPDRPCPIRSVRGVGYALAASSDD